LVFGARGAVKRGLFLRPALVYAPNIRGVSSFKPQGFLTLSTLAEMPLGIDKGNFDKYFIRNIYTYQNMVATSHEDRIRALVLIRLGVVRSRQLRLKIVRLSWTQEEDYVEGLIGLLH